MLYRRHGKLALEHGFKLPIQVLQSAAGFYIGTADESGPVSRESDEYYGTRERAEIALERGEWTQNFNF
jgi:hypothetical protein